MHIVEYLLNKGYKATRFIDGEHVPDSGELDFSTLRPGGLDIRLNKEDNWFCYGLNEANKPPSLIYPHITIEESTALSGGLIQRVHRVATQDQVNRLMRIYSTEEVYNICINKTVLPIDKLNNHG